MRYEITAPDEREGTVAGIAFAAGCAVVEDPPAGSLLYFRRHGYAVTCLDAADSIPLGFVASEPPAKPAPRTRSKQRSSKEE